MAPFSPPEAEPPADPAPETADDRRRLETCPLAELADRYESAFAGVHRAEVGLGEARKLKIRVAALFAARLAAEGPAGWFAHEGRRYRLHRDLRGVEREKVEAILPGPAPAPGPAPPPAPPEGGGP